MARFVPNRCHTPFYTHISDQYAPFSSKVVNVGVRDSTYVLDGLLHHESDLRIEEHYTDTAGFTDHVFALMHLLGFRFAPRIRDLSDTKVYVPNGKVKYQALAPMIGGTINLKAIRTHWNEILRLATSIKQGTVTASLMLRKLGSYPRQSRLPLPARRDQGPQLRAAALPRQRPYARHRRHRTLEYCLHREGNPHFRSERSGSRPGAVQVPFPARLGAHQLNRRLPMEGPPARPGQIQAAQDPEPPLTCSVVRFLKGPQTEQCRWSEGGALGAEFEESTSNGRNSEDEARRSHGCSQFEPDESRGSCPVPRRARGEIPRAYSTCSMRKMRRSEEQTVLMKAKTRKPPVCRRMARFDELRFSLEG
jgi:Tn3 transposase DDE domain